MDYEKAYKEALERAREELGSGCFDKGTVEYIFPELKESEDEKISREITEFILTHRIDEPNDIEDTNVWLAWLEKQAPKNKIALDKAIEDEVNAWLKKQCKWTDEDEERLQSCISSLQGKGLMGGVDTINTKWLKSLKQRIEQ